MPLETTETFAAEHLISPELLSRFSVLPEKLRGDIVEDVKKMHEAGQSFDDICERTQTLIAKGEELAEMDETYSDKEYRPPVNPEDQKLNEEEDDIIRGVEELIKTLEELTNPKKDEEKKETIH